ncbi:hypothetical protein QJS04_geneDACA014601 [Acorus gramineus]|uniref:Uncharacterized protein n=1 Tax=Acorus gramineus TaxID=55184 RepID=A0AAV9ANZ9_ACOGR|nr:hypothetical protein QJS04_geneDACA014601 [Acorus gramineus]
MINIKQKDERGHPHPSSYWNSPDFIQHVNWRSVCKPVTVCSLWASRPSCLKPSSSVRIRNPFHRILAISGSVKRDFCL